jgi:outer membrane protein OmpA-like peptidoglycan-associated protein
MKAMFTVSCLILAALLANGCASNRNLIVLLPDNTGHVGEVQITNKNGSQVVSKAWHASQIQGADAAPGTAVSIGEEEVDRIFGAALKALPEPPARFILHFKPETTELVKESSRVIPEVIREIKARNSRDIGVAGHTDTMGTDEYNMTLSYNRAVRIKEALVSKGVKSEDIDVSYFGQRNPLIQVGDNVPELRNRRVEIHVR